MRWSYKIVHYDYKKEGILGGTFLDEAEIEQSMNEIGKKSWELVSLLEVQDGLTATFKKPEEMPSPVVAGVARDVERPASAAARFLRTETVRPPAPLPDREVEREVSDEGNVPDDSPAGAVPEYRPAARPVRPAPVRAENTRKPVEEEKIGGVGSIRIE